MTISIQKITQRRTAMGMSVSEFAKRVGISRKTYYDWENDRKNKAAPVPDKYAKIISDVLCLDIVDLSEENKREMHGATVPEQSFDIQEVKNRIRWAINYIITEHDLSNVKLSRILGLSTSSIDSYRRGIKTPKFNTLAFIQNTYKISLDWIVDGLASQFTDDRRAEPFPGDKVQCAESDIRSDKGVVLPGEFVFIPQMAGTIRNGGLAPDDTTEMRIAFRRDWIARKGYPQNMSIIKIQGDSMEPTLLSGDLVLVDHSKDATTRGGLFAITIDQEILIKRIQPLRGSKLLVISDNEKYTTLEIAAENIHINGKVIWFAREIEK
jgi:phage repressor protein C with HTH and peptisase S24 domain/DNA-binding XRE family transcriptional regulator